MKRLYKNKICGMLIALALSASSCSESALLELNVNKNAVTDMNMAYLFSLATLNIGAEYENTRGPMLYAAPMIQHTASLSDIFTGDKYTYSAPYSGAYMETHYLSVVKLYTQVILETADDATQANVNGAAMIMKAFDLHRMTDMYGDIPYTTAGKGLLGEEHWFPVYENQRDVYYAMIEDLKSARDKMSDSSLPLGVQDFIYSGDVSKWKKFANSMLMRIALRMSNVDPARAQEVFTEAYASGAFTSNADNAYIHYLEGPQAVNRNGLNDGYWNTRRYSRDCKISRTFMNWMVSNNDPRLMIVSGGIGDPVAPSSWNVAPAAQKGMPNGYTSATLRPTLSPQEIPAFNAGGNTIYSMLNLRYLDWSDPYLLQTYSEVALMEAEAVLKGWITGDANTFFTQGVTAAVNHWTVFDASFAVPATATAAYVRNRGFEAASAEDKLRLIGEEYWAATYLNDLESWANWRRTSYPVLTPTQDPNRYEANAIPRRLKYWENEIASNPVKYGTAIQRMGGDNFMTRMWWDGGN